MANQFHGQGQKKRQPYSAGGKPSMQKQQPTQKPKPLVSTRKYTDQIIAAWMEENNPDPHLRDCYTKFLTFYLNVTHVKVMQGIAEAWEENRTTAFGLCQQGVDILEGKIRQCQEEAAAFLATYLAERQVPEQEMYAHCVQAMILCEILTVVQYMPSQLERYAIDRDRMLWIFAEKLLHA
ncbi:MAG: hypothetical protein IJU37_10210 [Desulfovibrio sp.]|nr:hypothetical protein [Desulfovibrio sp.]